MIDEALAQRAVQTVAGLVGEYWDSLDSEIQDDWTFILIRAHAPTEAAVEIPSELRREIAQVLNCLVPDHPSHSLGSWIVVVLHGGQVRDSILPNEF